jgi:hypothetical protein
MKNYEKRMLDNFIKGKQFCYTCNLYWDGCTIDEEQGSEECYNTLYNHYKKLAIKQLQQEVE